MKVQWSSVLKLFCVGMIRTRPATSWTVTCCHCSSSAASITASICSTFDCRRTRSTPLPDRWTRTWKTQGNFRLCKLRMLYCRPTGRETPANFIDVAIMMVIPIPITMTMISFDVRSIARQRRACGKTVGEKWYVIAILFYIFSWLSLSSHRMWRLRSQHDPWTS